MKIISLQKNEPEWDENSAGLGALDLMLVSALQHIHTALLHLPVTHNTQSSIHVLVGGRLISVHGVETTPFIFRN